MFVLKINQYCAGLESVNFIKKTIAQNCAQYTLIFGKRTPTTTTFSITTKATLVIVVVILSVLMLSVIYALYSVLLSVVCSYTECCGDHYKGCKLLIFFVFLIWKWRQQQKRLELQNQNLVFKKCGTNFFFFCSRVADIPTNSYEILKISLRIDLLKRQFGTIFNIVIVKWS